MLLVWASETTAQVLQEVTSGQEVQQVRALNAQVLQLYQRGQYAQALTLALKALKLSEDTLGSENADTAECLNNVGGMYDLDSGTFMQPFPVQECRRSRSGPS